MDEVWFIIIEAKHSQKELSLAVWSKDTYCWPKMNHLTTELMDGLSGDKANLSPAKLELADIGQKLSLAIIQKYDVGILKWMNKNHFQKQKFHQDFLVKTSTFTIFSVYHIQMVKVMEHWNLLGDSDSTFLHGDSTHLAIVIFP